MAENTKAGSKTGLRNVAGESATTEVSRVSITVVAILGVAVGVWSLACLAGGLAASGGPMGLVMNWFKAVTGM